MPSSRAAERDLEVPAWQAVRSEAWAEDGRTEPVERFVAAISSLPEDDELVDEVEFHRRDALRHCEAVGGPGTKGRQAVINILADLARQGRELRWCEQLEIRSAAGTADRRAELLAQSTEQLRTDTVQAFIRKMERRTWCGGRSVSITSLMRDGRELADGLRGHISDGKPLCDVTQPYLQIVQSGATCEHTGLLLTDIWRYFRHTWTMPYQSVPGRSMMMLVRDAAAEHHPIMGIAALGSAAVKVKQRDEVLGWHEDTVLDSLRQNAGRREVSWLMSIVEGRLGEIHLDDLVVDGVMSAGHLSEPDEVVITALRQESVRCRERHHKLTEASDYKRGVSSANSEADWVAQAETPLFRSKRCDELARLLHARMNLTSASITDLLDGRSGRRTISDVVRIARSIKVGTCLADLTVCGAIAPYGPLLGGKLTAMLAVSPEAVYSYRRRYADAPSLIASAMAGRRIVRPAELVYVTTSTLYDRRPCQYDRISVPTAALGGKGQSSIKFKSIATTEGWGSFQFSDLTMSAVNSFLRCASNDQRVNYVFGEGASPKLRNLRDGLVALGFDDKKLLRHGHSRVVFGVELAENASAYLLGRDSKPRYRFSLRSLRRSSDGISSWWKERYLARRLLRDGVLDQVRQHTLIHPILHGARVQLPRSDVEQTDLFE